METKHLVMASVAFVVTVVVAYLGYQHFKEKGDLREHQEKTISMLVDIAKNTPTGGVTEMGAALKKYAEDHKAYPESLQQLYPKYIPSKAFIDEVDWDYQRKNNDFFLKKTVTYQNRQFIASIDKTLRLNFGPAVMVASASDILKPMAFDPGKAMGGHSRPSVADTPERISGKEGPHKMTPDRHGVRDSKEKKSASRETRVFRPEAGTSDVEEGRPATGLALAASERYLVWKDQDGVLGFGNVDYPVSNDLSICSRGRWFKVKRKVDLEQKKVTMADVATHTSGGTKAQALPFYGHYLVWKEKDGTLGFGNVTYPDQ
jgi:hypothetical protein